MAKLPVCASPSRKRNDAAQVANGGKCHACAWKVEVWADDMFSDSTASLATPWDYRATINRVNHKHSRLKSLHSSYTRVCVDDGDELEIESDDGGCIKAPENEDNKDQQQIAVITMKDEKLPGNATSKSRINRMEVALAAARFLRDEKRLYRGNKYRHVNLVTYKQCVKQLSNKTKPSSRNFANSDSSCKFRLSVEKIICSVKTNGKAPRTKNKREGNPPCSELETTDGRATKKQRIVVTTWDYGFCEEQILLLLLAVGHGNIRRIRRLLRYVDPKCWNPQDLNRRFPLLIAASRGFTRVVRMLLRKGADVNQKTRDGKTALYAAVALDQVDTVKLLLENGAAPDAELETSSTCLLIASYTGNVRITASLLAHGADPNKTNNSGVTGLMCASFHGHVSVVQTLLAAGANVNARLEDGSSALFLAIRAGRKQVVHELVRHGADVNATMANGCTILIQAARHNQSCLFPLLKDADPNQKLQNGSTALIVCAAKGDLDGVRYLVDMGADVNATTSCGASALIYGVHRASFELVKALCLAGADIKMRTRYGTAIEVSRQQRNCRIMYFLELVKDFSLLQIASFTGDVKRTRDLLRTMDDLQVRQILQLDTSKSPLHVALPNTRELILQALEPWSKETQELWSYEYSQAANFILDTPFPANLPREIRLAILSCCGRLWFNRN